jgi:signal peptidase I
VTGAARRALSCAGTAVLALAAAAVLILATGWFRLTPVLSGSMRPAFQPGDAVLTQRVASDAVRPGEVLVIHIPAQYGGGLVVHRVTTVTRDGRGTVVTTKGDANNVADPWHATLPGTVYRVRTVLPYVGWIVDVKSLGGLLTLLAGAAVALFIASRRRNSRLEGSNMKRINKILVGVLVGGGVVAAVVGSGAGATFTESVFATQQVNAGHLDVTLTGPGTTSTDGNTITLTPLGPLGSTFTSGAQSITISNVGNVAAKQVSLAATETHSAGAGAAFANEVGVTVKDGGATVYDGLLSGLIASPVALTGSIAPNGTRTLRVTFYAGSGSVASLDNAAEGGSVTPTLTLNYSG